jgi:competence protein ComEC
VASGLLVALPGFRPPRRWCAALLAAWFALGFGLALGPLPQRGRLDGEQLACTFASVGHGTSVLVELPGGATLLYDAGRLGTPSSAARSIAALLWSRGMTHLDAVIISHADADHYNALAELLERFSVGVVYVSPKMSDSDSPALAALRASILAAGVRIEELAAGDRLDTEGPAQVAVLHPPRRGATGSDNANSIVLRIDFSGRTILLPGDLEPPGLEAVLARPPVDCDVVMAPHHGSGRSNPRGFAIWSTPEWVVISGGPRETIGVKNAYAAAGANVVHTARAGAVRVTVDVREVSVQAWRDDPWK